MFTWDDGTADHLTVANEAAARGQSHTFFVNSSTIGTAGFLTSRQVQDMYAAGHEIGSHCKTHLDMTALTVSEREVQYDSSKTAIESWIGVGRCTSLAHPYGAHNSAIDQETALRFDRTFLVEGTSKPWRQPIGSARSHNVMRLTWSSATHQSVLQAIRAAASQDTVAVIMSHIVGPGATITTAELLEGLDLAESMAIRCVTAQDALPCSNRLINPGLELPLGAWITAGDVAVVTDTPMTGMGGSKSLKLVSTANSYSEAVQSVPVGRIENYTLSGRYHSNQSDGYLKIIVRPLKADNTQSGEDVLSNLGVPLPWTRFTVGIAVPEQTVALQVFIFVQATGEGYVDHLWLTPDTHGVLG